MARPPCSPRFLLAATTLLAVLEFLSSGSACSLATAAERLRLEVTEAAGIKRFGYPVMLRLPPVSGVDATTRFRLLDGDKDVSAQFRHEKIDDGSGVWWLDFNVNMAPNVSRVLAIEYGADVQAASERTGLALEEMPDGFEIRNGQHLTWLAGRELPHVLKSVDGAGFEYLRPAGVQLVIEGQDGKVHELRDDSGSCRLIRSGPLAVAIRHSIAPKDGLFAETKSSIELTFPVSKSWVQVDWQIEDPRQVVRSIRADIAQHLVSPSDQQPTLVDFGASSLVYMSLGPGTAGKLISAAKTAAPMKTARPAWQVLRGQEDRLEPFVVDREDPSTTAEGWAHVMDRKRCLALAIADFGGGNGDSIEVSADGNVSVARQFPLAAANRGATKSIRFWLHFVGFPPRVTAATSPQSMLAPLVVRVSQP